MCEESGDSFKTHLLRSPCTWAWQRPINCLIFSNKGTCRIYKRKRRERRETSQPVLKGNFFSLVTCLAGGYPSVELVLNGLTELMGKWFIYFRFSPRNKPNCEYSAVEVCCNSVMLVKCRSCLHHFPHYNSSEITHNFCFSAMSKRNTTEFSSLFFKNKTISNYSCLVYRNAIYVSYQWCILQLC